MLSASRLATLSSTYLRFTSSAALVAIFLFFTFSLNYTLSNYFAPGFNPYDLQRILQLALLLTIALITLLAPKQLINISNIFLTISQPLRLAWLSLLLLTLTSAWLAPLPATAYVEVAMLTLLFWFAFFIAAQSCVWPRQFAFIGLLLLYFSVIYYLAYFFYFYGNMLLTSEHRVLLQFPGFVNLRFFSEWQIWTMPFLIAFTPKNKLLRIVNLLLFACWWSLAIANGAKGFWICYAIALALCFLLFKKTARHFLLLHVIGISVGGLLMLIIFYGIPQWIDKAPLAIAAQETSSTMLQNNVYSFDSSIGARLALSEQAYQLIKIHPWLGVGPQHFAYYRNDYGAHPHNAILLFACEWGLPALFLLLGISLVASRSWITHCSGTQTAPMAMTCAASAGLFYSLISGVVVTPLSQIMCAIVIGYMLSYYQRTHVTLAALRTRTRIMLRFTIVIILAIAILIIVCNVLPLLTNLTRNEILWFYAQKSGAVFSPRFWMQGWISP